MPSVALRPRRFLPALLPHVLLVLAGCGDGTDPGGGGFIRPLETGTVRARAGSLLTPGPGVRVDDALGRPRQGVPVRFALATTDGASRDTIVTTDSHGVARLTSLRMPELPGLARLTARELDGNQTATIDVAAFASGTSTLRAGGFDGTAAVGGEAVTLPAVQLADDGIPAAGVPVRYRVTTNNGTLSHGEVVTDGAGITEPVTLRTTTRGTIEVEILAAGYDTLPRVVTVHAVVPPVTFARPVPCEASNCHPFEFSWTSESTIPFSVRVQDAVGDVSGYPVRLEEIGEAGVLEWEMDGGYVLPVNDRPVLEAWGDTFEFDWSLPATPGSYRIRLSAPKMAEPWTFTAARP